MLLNIPATADSPELVFSPKKGHLTIMGNACGTNMAAFFTPILDAVKRYLRESDEGALKIIFRMENVNSSAAKYLMILLNTVSSYANPARELDVRWLYPTDHDTLRELGEDLAEDIDLPVLMQSLPREAWRKAS